MNEHLVDLGSCWTNPVRTGAAPAGVAGRMCPVDPAAAARLRELMAAQPRREPKRGEGVVGNLLRAAARKRKAAMEDGGMTKLTSGQVREAHARYMAGASWDELAEVFGVSQQALDQRFRKLGLQRRDGHPNQKLSDGDVERAAARLREGVPVATLARELGVDRSTLRQRLERAGLWLTAKEQRRAAELNPRSQTDELPGVDYQFVAPCSAPALVSKEGARPLQVVARFDEAPIGKAAAALGVLAALRDELAAAGIQLGFRLEGAGVKVEVLG